MPTNHAPRGRLQTCLWMIGYIILGVALAVAVAGFFLLGYAPVPKTTPHPVDMAKVRALAVEGGQPLPERLNALIVADGAYPSTMVVAGTGFGNRRMAFPTFQIVYADRTIVVDAPQSQAMHAQFFPNLPYYPAAWDQMQSALKGSSLILATHEHFDHIGGLAASPYLDEIRAKIRLTKAQLANAGPETGFTPAMLEGLAPLDYSGYTQAAPGVVLIEMPGHSKGSQMVYVKLQNGQEYLLVGDVVWSALSLQKQTGRSRLASSSLHEDPTVHGQQVRALIDLSAANPDLHLLISHDGEQIEQAIKDGLVGRKFE